MEKRNVRALLADERGLTTVEYVIVLCLIAAMSVGLWGDLGELVEKYVGDATKEIDGELSGTGG